MEAALKTFNQFITWFMKHPCNISLLDSFSLQKIPKTNFPVLQNCRIWHSIVYIWVILNIRMLPLQLSCNRYLLMPISHATVTENTNGEMNVYSWLSQEIQQITNSYHTFGHLKFLNIFFCTIIVSWGLDVFISEFYICPIFW